jgi:hypothetical protein
MNKNIQEHIHSASEFFFFCIGFLYTIGFLLQKNNILVVEFEYFVALSDNAFLLSALLYFFLSMLLKSENTFLLNRIDDNETKDFFWEESFYMLLGVVIFTSYFAIDLLG